MNKKYYLGTHIRFNTLEEVAMHFAHVMAELEGRSLAGEFEENETGLGFELEILGGADYDTARAVVDRYAGRVIDRKDLN